MIKNNNFYRRKSAVLRIASVLLTMVFVLMLAAPDFAYAAEKKTQAPPIREAHQVGVGNTFYCFFVTHNVVLTPEQVAKMTDEELTAYILDKAGLYMKKSNCKKIKNNKIISVKDWTKRNGAFYLSEPDLNSIRAAEPSDGYPVKFHMDLIVCEDVGDKEKEESGKKEKDTESEEAKEAEESGEDKATEEGEEDKTAEEGDADKAAEEGDADKAAEEGDADKAAEEGDADKAAEEGDADKAAEEGDADKAAEESGEDNASEEAEETDEADDIPLYSTFKRNEPELIFAVVSTKSDAAAGEDMCKEDKSKAGKNKTPTLPDMDDSEDAEDEMLPEYRTITMVDRSGKPIEATLEDGDPVKLEWVEQKNNSGNEEGASFIDRIPGGVTGLVIICAAAAAAVIAAVVMAGKKKRADL